MATRSTIVPTERIERAILLIRGQKVMLDADLALLYGVPTGVLIQAVKRNLARFAADFMFQLTRAEAASLRSQIVILKRGLATSVDLARKLDALERRYDAQFKVVFDAIRALMAPSPSPRG